MNGLSKAALAGWCLLGVLSCADSQQDSVTRQSQVAAAKVVSGVLRDWTDTVRTQWLDARKQKIFAAEMRIAESMQQVTAEKLAGGLQAAFYAVSKAYVSALQGTAMQGQVPLADWLPAGVTAASTDILYIDGDNYSISGASIDGVLVDLAVTAPMVSEQRQLVFTVSGAAVQDAFTVLTVSGGRLSAVFADNVDLSKLAGDIPIPQKFNFQLQSTLSHHDPVSDRQLTFHGGLSADALYRQIRDKAIIPGQLRLTGGFSEASTDGDIVRLDAALIIRVRNASVALNAADFKQGQPAAAIATYTMTGGTLHIRGPFTDLTLNQNPATKEVILTRNGIFSQADYMLGQHDDLRLVGADVITQALVPVGGVGLYRLQAPAVWAAQGDLDGSLEKPFVIRDAAGHWQDLEVELSYRERFDRLPPARLRFRIDRMGFLDAMATISIEYDDIRMQFQASAAALRDKQQARLYVSITKRGENARLSMEYDNNKGATKGFVTVNGQQVGTISQPQHETLPIINYSNGDFETLLL